MKWYSISALLLNEMMERTGRGECSWLFETNSIPSRLSLLPSSLFSLFPFVSFPFRLFFPLSVSPASHISHLSSRQFITCTVVFKDTSVHRFPDHSLLPVLACISTGQQGEAPRVSSHVVLSH